MTRVSPRTGSHGADRLVAYGIAMLVLGAGLLVVAASIVGVFVAVIFIAAVLAGQVTIP